MSALESAGLGFVALFHLAMGMLALWRPERLMAIFGVALTPEGRNEVSAVYGGFGIAVSGALAYCLFAAGPLQAGIRAQVAIALFGMACGRLIAFVRDRRVDLHPSVTFLVAEGAMAAFSWP